ncbi:MAG: type II secretion system F family protein [Porticoccaceae bacterium]
MHPLMLSALLLGGAGVLLVAALSRDMLARRTVLQRLGRGGAAEALSPLKELGSRTLGRRGLSLDTEAIVLLDQLGWRKSGQRSLYFTVQLGLPLLVAAAFAGRMIIGEPSASAWLALAFATGIAYLVPKRLLVMAVKKRRECLAVEVSTMIPLLRMLFEVGMTVEQALRVLNDEGRKILPQMTVELRQVLARVDAGLELGGELRAVAALVEVDEVTDCFIILDQLIRQGGGAMASLLALKQLLDDRRMTTLQERVSKLSAKMSAVMVAFLFPALLIVLAGPGFVAIFRALGGVGE